MVLKPIGAWESHPSRIGLPYQHLTIPVNETDSQTEIDAFWIPASRADAPVILYLHGQDATIGKNLHHAERFHDDLGVHVLIVEYRGFGTGFGQTAPSEEKMYRDAESGLDYLQQVLGFPADRIVIFGHSLGGAVAIELAKRRSEVAGLVVESTFTSVVDMSHERYLGLLRFVPVSLLLNQRFDSISKVDQIQIPMLFIHGTSDAKVPCWMTARLHDQAQSARRICWIEGADHDNCGLVGTVDYCHQLNQFLTDCLAEVP